MPAQVGDGVDSREAVGAALRRGTLRLVGSPSPRLDAEVLLAHVLGIGRSALLAATGEALRAEDAAVFDEALRRRDQGEPVAYITGRAHFHTISLEVTPDVLVPRPESEMLVEWALERLASRDGKTRVLDVGTGSGAIALAIAAGTARAEAHAADVAVLAADVEFHATDVEAHATEVEAHAADVEIPAKDAEAHATDVEVHATDVSGAALEVARRNATRLGLADRVAWHHADLLPDSELEFDLVVANLPYIGESEMADVEPGVLAFEPLGALLAGGDGLVEVRRLLSALPGRLARRGAVALEIGWRQGPSVVRLARAAFPAAEVALRQDLAGQDRVVVIDTADRPDRKVVVDTTDRLDRKVVVDASERLEPDS